MERFPILWESSFLDSWDDGREEVLLLRIKERRLSRLEARLGLLGFFKGEKPVVGLDVRITGEEAARSSSETGSTPRSLGLEKAP